MPTTRSVAVMLLLSTVAACGGGGGSTDPDGNGGGGGGGGDGVARLVLTIEGQAGTERDMTVRYVIADGPTTRAAASAILPTPFGCFSDVDPVCPIDVPVGKTISLFAIEGEGYVAGDAGNGRPVPPPDPLRHEFVSYVGDCETSATLGDCVLHVTADREYNIRAQFAEIRRSYSRSQGPDRWRISSPFAIASPFPIARTRTRRPGAALVRPSTCRQLQSCMGISPRAAR